MASGPPIFGDNRFAILASSPTAKKKKLSSSKLIDAFPELPKVQSPNPKFVVISSLEETKPISDFSCLAVQRSLHLISKEIISISELRDGSLLLLVQNKLIANKFLSATQLHGLCKIKCTLHNSLNLVKGTIYAPYLNKIPDDEITEELSSQGVVSVFKFSKIVDGKSQPSGVLLLSFDLYKLPDKIDISWHSIKVREYIPNPMRCRNCQLLGHTMKRCKNASTCANCNLPPHPTQECTRIFCANCADNHPATSKECKKYIQQKEILKIKTRKKCSMREARQLHKAQTQTISSPHTYASTLITPHSSTINPTTQLNKPPTKTLTLKEQKSNTNSAASSANIINFSLPKPTNQQSRNSPKTNSPSTEQTSNTVSSPSLPNSSLNKFTVPAYSNKFQPFSGDSLNFNSNIDSNSLSQSILTANTLSNSISINEHSNTPTTQTAFTNFTSINSQTTNFNNKNDYDMYEETTGTPSDKQFTHTTNTYPISDITNTNNNENVDMNDNL